MPLFWLWFLALLDHSQTMTLNHSTPITERNIIPHNPNEEQGSNGSLPKNVFMVFEYLEYDLTGVLETPEIRLTQDHVKSWSQQLLNGVHYMHKNKVIHRDLKASNLLINRNGELKIADWGLARSWNSEMKRLTNKVITLWYRPPELLLGMIDYSTKIDMWSVGCIIAEMFRRSGFLKGRNEAHQLELIYKVCGTPNTQEWPNLERKCRLWKKFAPGPEDKIYPNRLAQCLRENLPHPRWMTDSAVNLIGKLMEKNPDTRWSAEEALVADYFFESPIVKQAKDLNMKFAVAAAHEMGKYRDYTLVVFFASFNFLYHPKAYTFLFLHHCLRLPQEVRTKRSKTPGPDSPGSQTSVLCEERMLIPPSHTPPQKNLPSSTTNPQAKKYKNRIPTKSAIVRR